MFTPHVHTTLNLEETCITPLGTPGVLDQPVVKIGLVIVSVSNSKHGMVHIRGAVLAQGGSVDTSADVCEVISDLESNGDRLRVDGLFELNLVTGGDVDRVANLEDKGRRIHSAVAVFSKVGVCLF